MASDFARAVSTLRRAGYSREQVREVQRGGVRNVTAEAAKYDNRIHGVGSQGEAATEYNREVQPIVNEFGQKIGEKLVPVEEAPRPQVENPVRKAPEFKPQDPNGRYVPLENIKDYKTQVVNGQRQTSFKAETPQGTYEVQQSTPIVYRQQDLNGPNGSKYDYGKDSPNISGGGNQALEKGSGVDGGPGLRFNESRSSPLGNYGSDYSALSLRRSQGETKSYSPLNQSRTLNSYAQSDVDISLRRTLGDVGNVLVSPYVGLQTLLKNKPENPTFFPVKGKSVFNPKTPELLADPNVQAFTALGSLAAGDVFTRGAKVVSGIAAKVLPRVVFQQAEATATVLGFGMAADYGVKSVTDISGSENKPASISKTIIEVAGLSLGSKFANEPAPVRVSNSKQTPGVILYDENLPAVLKNLPSTQLRGRPITNAVFMSERVSAAEGLTVQETNLFINTGKLQTLPKKPAVYDFVEVKLSGKKVSQASPTKIAVVKNEGNLPSTGKDVSPFAPNAEVSNVKGVGSFTKEQFNEILDTSKPVTFVNQGLDFFQVGSRTANEMGTATGIKVRTATIGKASTGKEFVVAQGPVSFKKGGLAVEKYPRSSKGQGGNFPEWIGFESKKEIGYTPQLTYAKSITPVEEVPMFTVEMVVPNKSAGKMVWFVDFDKGTASYVKKDGISQSFKGDTTTQVPAGNGQVLLVKQKFKPTQEVKFSARMKTAQKVSLKTETQAVSQSQSQSMKSAQKATQKQFKSTSQREAAFGSVGSRSAARSTSIVLQKARSKVRFAPLFKVNSDQAQASAQATGQASAGKFGVSFKAATASASASRTAQAFKTGLRSAAATSQALRTDSKLAQSFKQTFGSGKPKFEEKPGKERIIPKLKPSSKEERKSRQGYNVLVKSRGKFIKVNQKALTKDAAFDLGARAVDETTAATFKLAAAKGKVSSKGSDQYFSRKQNQFREKKTKKEILTIEKNRYRINTGGEFRGITIQGWLAQRRRRR